MPTHHLPDEMLVAQAAGSLGESESLLVACHLTLCPRCRERVEAAESLGAVLLDRARAADVPDSLLDRILAATEQPDAGPGAAVGGPVGDPRGVLPAPLFALTGDLERAAWRRIFPGIAQLALPAPGDGKLAALVRVAPGGRIPTHGHVGFEGTLVLAGGFSDDRGHFARGDVALRDARTTHDQRIDEGEPCIWLLVADGRPVPRTLGGWLARLLLRV